MLPSVDNSCLGEHNVVKRHFKPLLEVTGLPKTARFYNLRHTHATLLPKAGVHPKI